MRHLASTILGTLFSVQLLFGAFHATRAADVTVTGQVTARPALSFQISVPASGVAGQPFSATITALDADGLPTTGVSQDVSLSTTNGGTITPLTIPLSEFTDDGVWTGTITLTQVGLARTIFAQSGAATGQTTIDIFAPGPTSFLEQVGQVVTQLREALRQSPVARIITGLTPVLGPIATTTAIITALTQLATAAPVLVSIGDAFLYISYLWSVLLEFLGLKRRRKPWGIVYNAQDKEPIPLVVVQLIDEESGQPVEQRVTDPYGRFGFLVKPGRYRIKPIHPHFSFPSKTSPEKGDLRYADLYHGEEIGIEDPNTVLAVNIPMDPLAPELAAVPSRFPRLSFRRISFILLIASVLLQGLTVFIEPSAKNIRLFVGYLTILIVMGFLLRRIRRTWGVVYDAQTKEELANAQVFVSSDEDPRFTSRKVTNELGRFYLLLPKGTYRLAVQYPGYQFPGPRESVGYKGEPLSVTPQHPLIHVDIPVAPTEPTTKSEPEEAANPQFVRLT